MPKYLFTSDQRISVLPSRIQWVSGFIQKGHNVSDITDKSDNNNAATLKFYYNLHEGTETCQKAVDNPLFAIRNFVLKFQFPNIRTQESLLNSLAEKCLFAPFRSVVSCLYKMAVSSEFHTSQLTVNEILYYLFCNPQVYRNPLVNYDNVIEAIKNGRKTNTDLNYKIAQELEWNQYGRQVKEMLNVLTYASSCFKLASGVLSFSMNSYKYNEDKDFINQILGYSKFWYPTNPSDFKLSTSEYISYMDTKNTPYSIIDFSLDAPKAKLSKIKGARQQIYYGAPGTGKSHVINEMTQGEDVIRTTFHPDSDYSTFVGAYKPTTKEVVMRDLSGHPIYEGDKELYEDKIVYEFVDQAFLQAYVKAWKDFAEAQDGGEPKKQFLVIEEINRGNCAQIFGDLFQLLDRNDYGFSDYPIQADKDMKKQLAKAFSGLEIASAERINAIYNKDVVSKVLSGEELLLPSNLYIWATMNTSDQSLFPIDSAFKRRWDWQYMPISKGHDDKTGAEINWRIQGETKEYDWWSFLEKINEHIDSTTNSEDKKLGFFFCKAKDNVISSETFVGKVIFYLWNDVFKDYGFDDSIFDDVNGSKLSFNKFYSTDSKGMTIVQKDKVERFLDNLGVAIAGEIDDEEFIDSDSDDNVDKNIDDNVDYNNQGGGNDYSKFSINGSGQYNKGAVVYDAIKMYCDNNPTMSAEDVVAKWLALNVKMPNLVETEAVHEQRRQKGNDPFFDRRSNVLVLKDGTKIFVSTQFTKSRINDLISKVNSQNWGITIAKV